MCVPLSAAWAASHRRRTSRRERWWLAGPFYKCRAPAYYAYAHIPGGTKPQLPQTVFACLHMVKQYGCANPVICFWVQPRRRVGGRPCPGARGPLRRDRRPGVLSLGDGAGRELPRSPPCDAGAQAHPLRLMGRGRVVLGRVLSGTGSQSFRRPCIARRLRPTATATLGSRPTMSCRASMRGVCVSGSMGCASQLGPALREW